MFCEDNMIGVTKETPNLLFHIIYVSLTISLLFSGYSITTSFVSVIYGKYGYYSYMLIYITTIIGSIISSYMVDYFGIKWTLIFGSFFYVMYISLFNLHSNVLLLISSIITGFGSGIMRTQQNNWLSSMIAYEPHKDLYVGIFNCIFGTYSIIGSLISLVIFIFNLGNISTLVWIMLGTTIISWLLLFPMKNPDIENKKTNYIELLKNWKLYMFFPLIIFQGGNITYIFLTIPLLLQPQNNIDLPQCGKSNNNTYCDIELVISLIFLIYGIFYSLTPYLFGFGSIIFSNNIFSQERRVMQLFGHDPNNIYHLILCLFVILQNLSVVYFTIHFESNYYYLIVGMICGINDGIVNYLITVLLIEYFPQQKSVFAIHRAIYSFFSAILALTFSFVEWYNPLIFLTAIIFLSLTTYNILIRY